MATNKCQLFLNIQTTYKFFLVKTDCLITYWCHNYFIYKMAAKTCYIRNHEVYQAMYYIKLGYNFTSNQDMRFPLITIPSGGSHTTSPCYLGNHEAMYYIELGQNEVSILWQSCNLTKSNQT